MCGRFVITSPPAALRQIFGYIEQPNFPPRHNIAPTQPVPVVIIENGARHFRLMRWGFLPAWVKDPRQFSLVINARSETLLEKPAFKNAIKRRRCLIPADGYYEWQTSDKRKRPFLIPRADGGAIVTAPASADLAVLHHRVPVTIAPDDFERWLDCRANDAEMVMALMTGPDGGEFTWHEVSTRVNHVANDDAQLVLPITAEQRAAEGLKPAKKAATKKPAPVVTEDDGQGSLF